MFSRLARRYDILSNVITLGQHRRWKRAVAAVASRGGGSGPGLDIATGTGELAFTLGEMPNVTSMVGIDLSRPMLRVADRKAGTRDAGCNVNFLQADALALPFENDAFLCAVAGFALRNVEDLEQCIAETVRVLRPGGRLAALDMTPVKGWSPLRPLVSFHVRRFVPLVAHLLADDRSSYSYISESIDRFPDADGLADLFRAAGLEDVGYRRMNMGILALHWGTKPGTP